MKKIRVLFLCTGNSARSIIGAALLQADGRRRVRGATAPARIRRASTRTRCACWSRWASICPASARRTSPSTTGSTFDYVITVCDAAAEECPVFPGAPERIHWSFVDPAAVEGTDDEKLRAFQGTVREMKMRLNSFVEVAKRTAAASARRRRSRHEEADRDRRTDRARSVRYRGAPEGCADAGCARAARPRLRAERRDAAASASRPRPRRTSKRSRRRSASAAPALASTCSASRSCSRSRRRPLSSTRSSSSSGRR